MNVCVFGCWHLGSVTAAGLATLGHRVIGLDPDAEVVARLRDAEPPVAEPGLGQALAAGIDGDRLSFTTDAAAALAPADVVWVTFDTPVDDEDRGDPAWVIDHVVDVIPRVRIGAVVLTSSQLPVGSTAELERRAARREVRVPFAYSPENLRLGRAMDSFLRPARVVVGVRHEPERVTLESLFGTITEDVVWMSVESAEMTKHALNAWLATSVAFTNEIATLCEQVGADAREVERGLRTDPRVGPRAYVAPGGAFGGGTLARDVRFLGEIGNAHSRATPLLDAVITSNVAHRGWPLRTLEHELGGLAQRHIAVLGLTYTAGTSTLRRSPSLDLCRALVERQAIVRTHDPAAEALPSSLQVRRETSVEAAIEGVDAVVVATGWPEYRSLPADCFASRLVVDADGFLADTLRNDPRVRYRSVGTST